MKLKYLFLISVSLLPLSDMGCFAAGGDIDTRLNVGYGFRAGPNYLYSNTGAANTVVPYSLGAGFNVGIGGTYWFEDHLGLALDINSVFGSPAKNVDVTSSGITDNYSWRGSLLTFTPQIVLSANRAGINPYGRFGFSIGSASFTYEDVQTGPSAHAGTYIDKYSGGVATGLYSAFGLEYGIDDNVKIFAEAFDCNMSYAPAQVENTQAFNDAKKLPTVTFVESKDKTSANNTLLKAYFPFSSAGLKIGVSFRF
jgi:hypothetical protein